MSHIHLSLTDVSFSYPQQREILHNISFSMKEGESVGLIGENGAGKSTILKLMTGLCTGYSGEIRIEDVLVQKSTLPYIRERIGYVFQDSDSQLFMPSVFDDVAFAPLNYGLSKDEVKRRVEKALAEVNALHLIHRKTHQLSGGEKKLVSIASILSMIPDIILMDEPSAALDPKNRRNLIRIVNSFSHIKIIASHDLDFIKDTCSRVILLHQGRIAADAPAQDILNDKTFLEQHGL